MPAVLLNDPQWGLRQRVFEFIGGDREGISKPNPFKDLHHYLRRVSLVSSDRSLTSTLKCRLFSSQIREYLRISGLPNDYG